MNEETPQQNPAEAPAEEPQVNATPGPNPEKKTKKKLYIFIAVVLALLAAGALAWYMMLKPVSKPETKSTTAQETTKSDAKVAADPYEGWSTFTGTCSGASFKYPADWKVTYGDKTSENGCQLTKITSPTGNILVWVPQYYGDGPGCDYTDAVPKGTNDCPTVTTLSVEQLGPIKGLDSHYLAKQIVCDDKLKCEGRVVIAAAVVGGGENYPAYTVGSVKRYPLTVFGKYAFFMSQGKQTSYGNPETPILNFTEASAKDWLNSADVANAILSLKSLTIK